MAELAVVTIAIGNERITAGFDLQHVGKVFCAHGRLLCLHVVWPHDAGHDLARKVDLRRTVDGRRVIAFEREFSRHAVGCAGVLGDGLHALLDHVKHLNGKGAHRAL
jgi:hypothetical protein